MQVDVFGAGRGLGTQHSPCARSCEVDKYVQKVLAETPADVEEVIIEKARGRSIQPPAVFQIWSGRDVKGGDKGVDQGRCAICNWDLGKCKWEMRTRGGCLSIAP